MRDEIIVRNSVRCLACGDEIVSGHRHDFKYCSCGNVAVDGGQAYTRRVYKPGALWLDTSIYAEPPATREELLDGVAMMRLIKAGSRPLDDVWAAAPLLDDWKILPARVPPAADGMSELEGVVTGHPDFRDGQRIRTTPLLFESKDRPWARTVTKWWRLGTRSRETLQ